MRIVLDTSVLARAHMNSNGPARKLLLQIIASNHTLVTSHGILFELARVLRYPRMMALHRLSELEIYRYILFLQQSSQLVRPDPLLLTPIRDCNDTIVMQTAIIGSADMLCTKDQDFFQPPAHSFLSTLGIEVCDDVTLLRQFNW